MYPSNWRRRKKSQGKKSWKCYWKRGLFQISFVVFNEGFIQPLKLLFGNRYGVDESVGRGRDREEESAQSSASLMSHKGRNITMMALSDAVIPPPFASLPPSPVCFISVTMRRSAASDRSFCYVSMVIPQQHTPEVFHLYQLFF